MNNTNNDLARMFYPLDFSSGVWHIQAFLFWGNAGYSAMCGVNLMPYRAISREWQI
jgi:hypothetical protein